MHIRALFTRKSARRALWAVLIVGAALLVALGVTTAWLYVRADETLLLDLKPRVVNDVTQLNPTQVARVEQPTTTEQIAQLLHRTSGPVSIGGARCSMGGQISEPGSLHLDMRRMNRVLEVNPDARLVTVQAGCTWRDVQDAIDPHGLSVKIMQTYSNFTVGGSLSVNAHGRYMGRGPLVQSVRALRLVLADGSIVTASPSENSELFFGAIGGYGGLGVIAEATLQLENNSKVVRHSQTMETADYPAYFKAQVRDDARVVFHNADLHPPDFATARAISWLETDEELTEPERLIPRDQQYDWMPLLINGVPSFPGGFALRKHVLEPLFYSQHVVTWRNHEASYDIAELEPQSRSETTFVLREYFVPAEQLAEFIPVMRDIFRAHDVQVVNVSVRHASGDPGTLLAWARGETFALVVYYEQGTRPEDIAEVAEWSRELVDAVLAVGGTYYLPYQNHATAEQFERAYPRAPEFFALKRRVDPTLRFQNSLFHDYGPSPRADLERKLQAANYERKPEGQSLLTIPEWYLVFNPAEYAEHLQQGNPSDDFPFFASVEEYMSLYKKVLAASDGVYPPNEEYQTMLRVIGVSTAVEYLVKGSYEASVGRLFRATRSGVPSREDVVIAQAHRAYSDLINERAWYEFGFWDWVSRIWSETRFWGEDFLRRSERKLAFTAEFTVKSLYAALIGWAAKSAYDAPSEQVHLLVRLPASGLGELAERVTLLGDLGEGRTLISVGRWGEFSRVVPRLTRAGVEILEIAGNDDIAVSALSAHPLDVPSSLGAQVLTSRVVSQPSLERSVWWVPVAQLGPFLDRLQGSGAQFEHLYDY